MDNMIIESMNETSLTPSDFISLMFEHTDQDGILYIPGWEYMRPGWMCNAPGSTEIEDVYRCKIDWDLEKKEKALKEFGNVYSLILKLASFYGELVAEPQKASEILKDNELFEIWDTYIKDLDIGGFDQQKYDEIYNKLDAIAEVRCIEDRVANGEEIEDFEKEILSDNSGVTVTEAELKYHEDYMRHLHSMAEARLGKGICAYDVLLRAWRVWSLESLGAPSIIMNNEGRQLAAAFVLHKYGISQEIVEKDD